MAIAKDETYVEKLTEILVKKGTIKEEEGKALKKAFKESEQEIFDDFLIEEGLVETDDLLAALAQYYQVPSFDVVGYFFESDLVRMFPKDILLRCEMIPLEVDENMLIMVAAEPDLPELLEIIGNYVSYDIQFRVGIARDIWDAVKEFYDEADTETKEGIDQDLRLERQRVREELALEEKSEGTISYTDDEEI